MAKNKTMLNNQANNGITILDNPDVINEKDRELSVRSYNASASNIDVDKLVNSAIKNWDTSKEREWMLTGIKYFENESEIDTKKRYDHCGTYGKENTKLSNAKIHRAFMRKLTRQKVNHAFGNPFSLTIESDDYKKELEDNYFTKEFYRLLQTLGMNSVQEGINWLQPYYNEKGELKYRRVPGNQVKVFWNDIEHTDINCLIHYYGVDLYVGDEVKDSMYADYYDGKGVIHYVKKDDGLYHRVDESKLYEEHFFIPVPQMEEIKDKKDNVIGIKPVLDEEGNLKIKLEPYVWEKIPFIPFKYNSSENSLIKYIKSLIDMYEKLLSMNLDIIIDIPDNIKVIKGYGGANLEDLTNKIAEYRAILVDGNGSVESLETKFDVTSSEKILDRLRKDIYEDGSGVDTQNTSLGDKSGVALKFLYADLDLDCREFINEFRLALEQLMFFIDFDIQLKTNKDYSEEEVTFNFKTSNIIDEEALIGMINDSRDMIPDEILLPKHPFVDDVTEVEAAIKRQEAKAKKEAEEMMGQLGGIPNSNPTNNPNIPNQNKQANNPVNNAINNPSNK